MPKGNKIIAIVTAIDGNELGAHFISHYTRLGVDELHVVVSKSGPVYDHYRQLFHLGPLFLHPVHDHKMGEAIKTHAEREIVSQIADPNDWILHLDLDEFHEYPFLLRSVTRILDEVNTPLIASEFVDRLSETGELVPLLPSPSIFSQFPIGSTITKSWLNLPSSKVMICKAWVKLYYGRHAAENVSVSPIPLKELSSCRVHHFKWFSGVQSRLLARAQVWEGMDQWYQARNENFVSTIQENRIDPSAVPGYEWCGEYHYVNF